ENLKREGEKLFANLKQLAPEFVEAWKAGRYKKRSIALYPDGTLRHVGFLGAQPPAVKGLADATFADPPAVEMEFSEPGLSTVAVLFSRLREFLIEKFGTETADHYVSNYDVDFLRQEAQRGEPEQEQPPAVAAFSEENPKKGEEYMEQELQKNLAASQARVAALEAENVSLKADIVKKDAATAESAKTGRKKEHAEFCEGLVKEGKLTPAQKSVAMGIMELISTAGEYEFSEGEKKAPLAEFKTLLGSLPKTVNLEEVARKEAAAGQGTDESSEFSEAAPERLALHNQITARAKKDNISYVEAAARVAKSGGK
ncbi:MAG: peptidase, partial [Elusimicrobia bacterium]|nr:peptidase [Elusimicrobiota bacterium]